MQSLLTPTKDSVCGLKHPSSASIDVERHLNMQAFLQYAASIDFNWVFTGSDTHVQLQFDTFYSVALNLLDTFYADDSA